MQDKDFDYRSLDTLFHSRIRLAAVSILLQYREVEFNLLKQETGATDGNLSSHLRKLEEAGYIQVRKTFEDRKPKSFYSLTEKGRSAFEEYLRKLEQFIRPLKGDGEEQ
jgi:DNA-binding MarR family transcriptional regulator